MPAFLKFSRNPKWLTYSRFFVFFFGKIPCLALNLTNSLLNRFYILEYERTDTWHDRVHDVSHLWIFQKSKMADWWPVLCYIFDKYNMFSTVFQISSTGLFSFLGIRKYGCQGWWPPFWIFFKFQNDRLMTHFTAAASQIIIECLTPVTVFLLSFIECCSDILESLRRWTTFQNFWKIQNVWCNLYWVINQIDIVISLKTWISGAMFTILKQKLSWNAIILVTWMPYILSKWNVST